MTDLDQAMKNGLMVGRDTSSQANKKLYDIKNIPQSPSDGWNAKN